MASNDSMGNRKDIFAALYIRTHAGAHIAVTKKWKKFQHMTLEDWLNSEEHAFFFSKLVALYQDI